jgi:hypothetical protein
MPHQHHGREEINHASIRDRHTPWGHWPRAVDTNPNSTTITALVSLHQGHHNKTPGDRFGAVENGSPWTAVELPLDALVDHISSGKAFVNCQLTGGRNNDSCRASNLIVLDVDGDLTLDEFWAIPFAQRHCALTYTSCSHLNDAKQQERKSRTNHSFRAIFLAERIEIDQPGGTELYAERYHLLVEQLGIQLKDSSPAKPAQLWFGNDATEIHFGQAVPLNWEFTSDASDRVRAKDQARSDLNRAAAPPLDDDGLDEQRAVFLLDHLLRPSQDGDFSGGYWVQVLNACAASGSDAVREAFLAWHSRGHHSKTQKGITRRYDKAGNRSGLAKLFALAKEQHGSSWYQKLPEQLRRKCSEAPQQPKVLYSKASPTVGSPLPTDIEAPVTVPSPQELEEFQEEAARHLYSGKCSKAPQQPKVLYSKASPTVGSPLPTDIEAPVTVPSPQELEEFQEEAVRHLYSGSGGGHTILPEHNESPWDRAQQLHNLLHQLYLLRTHGLCIVNGKREVVPNHLKAEEDRNLLSAIMECRGYANAPSEVERDLIRHFRFQHRLYYDESAPVACLKLTGNPKNSAKWLVPNWFLAKREHVIYSKAGVGKTYLAIHIARVLTGDPDVDSFLDSGPINGAERWRKSRVLFIATDMHDSAYEQTETYLEKLALTDLEFHEYVDWWMERRDTGNPPWTLTLPNLLRLYNHLKEHRDAGMPVSAVIIDSMKEVCPEHLLIGQQAIKDYLRLAYDICSLFDAALIWIHHASGNNTGAQGIQRITEAASAVFKLERDQNRQVTLNVEKIRGGYGREMIIDPFATYKPKLVAMITPGSNRAEEKNGGPVLTNSKRRHMQILDVLQIHFAEYQKSHPEESGASMALNYKGMTIKQIQNAGVDAGNTTLQRDLKRLQDSGEIQSRGHSSARSYRIRLSDQGEPCEPFDLFTAGG